MRGCSVLDCGTSISPLLPVSGCHELPTGSDTICTSGCRDLSGTRADVLSHAQVRRGLPGSVLLDFTRLTRIGKDMTPEHLLTVLLSTIT